MYPLKLDPDGKPSDIQREGPRTWRIYHKGVPEEFNPANKSVPKHATPNQDSEFADWLDLVDRDA